MTAIFSILAQAVGPVALIAAVGLSIFGLLRLSSPVIAARGDRRTAIGLAIVAGLVVGGILDVLLAPLATMGTGPRLEAHLAMLPYVIPAALLAAGMSLGGFAVLTLRRPERTWALVGSLFGPVVLVTGLFGVMGVTSLLRQLANADAEQMLHDRSREALEVQVRDIGATFAERGDGQPSLETLSVVISIRPTRETVLTRGEKTPWCNAGIFHDGGTFTSEYGINGDRTTLSAGVELFVPIELDVNDPSVTIGARPPTAGGWTAKVWLEDADGHDFEVVVPFEVAPPD